MAIPSSHDIVAFDNGAPAAAMSINTNPADTAHFYGAHTSRGETNGTRAEEAFGNDLHTPIPVPYFAPTADLPATAKLPQVGEIESSQEVLASRTAVKVVALGRHFVAKYGKGVDLDEGKMMIFVHRAKVPVPQVYALYSHCGRNFIVMERIQGCTLESKWPTLRGFEKSIVAKQIKQHILRMRSIRSFNAYCSLGNKPLRDPLFCTVLEDLSLIRNGPFQSESDLNSAIIRKCQRSEVMKGKAKFYQASLPVVLCGHPPVLSHTDLQRKNIIIRASSDPHIDLVFLDWETAGWYPSYWEYFCAIRSCGFFDDDWHQYVDDFLEHYRNEYVWLYTLANELCF